MDQNTNEERSPAVDNGLENLPSHERKETQDILDEIAADEARASGDKKPEETAKQPDEKKPDEAKKPEGDDASKEKKPKGEGEDDQNGKKTEPRREMKLVPAWVLEKERSDWLKQKAELEKAAADARAASQGREKGQEEHVKSDDVAAALDKAAEEMAEKHGITVELAKEILSSRPGSKGELAPEVVEALKDVGKLKAEAEATAEATAYSADFNKLIVPLIKAEYGDDVSPEVISKIQEELKELAYNPDFAKVPYTTLYKGEDKFRDLVPAPKRGAEGPGGSRAEGKGGSDDGKPDLSKPLPDAVVRTLSPEDFDTYSDNMVKWERTQK